ncbi:MAG: hypothetical protein Q4D16_22090 [Eubacteriales bacterium]|nr:hypothetical protein [Eubacteriales bacterium]
MSKHKCQVCDGPIVNGRCTWCGMPYRNDEILYHLNESRSDHYRHATDKARDELRESQIPLGDKKPGKEKGSVSAGKARQPKPAPGNSTVYKSSMPGRSGYTAESNKYKRPSVGQYTAGNTRKPGSMGGNSEKKKSAAGVVLVIIIAICTFLPAGIEYVKDNYSYELSSLFKTEVNTDNLQIFYMVSEKDGKVLVEDWYPEGEYVVEIDGGYATFVLQRGGSTKTYDLTEEHSQVSLPLKHGDTIYLKDADQKERYAYIFLGKES